MSVGDLIGNTLLGSGHGRTYTAQEQRAYSAKYPSLVWRDGVPYVPEAADTRTDEEMASTYGPNPQYWPTRAAGNTLVEADLNDPNFLAQLGRFAAGTSAAKFVAEGGLSDVLGGGASAGAPSATATAAPTASAAAGGTSVAPALASSGMSAGAKLGLGLAGLGLDAVTTFYGLKNQSNATKANQQLGQAQIASNEKIAGMNADQAKATLAEQARQHDADNALTREQFQLNAQLAREQLAQAAQQLAQRRADLAPFLNALAAGLMPKGASGIPALPSTGGGEAPAPPAGGAEAPPSPAPEASAGGFVPEPGTPGQRPGALSASGLAATQGKRALTLAELGA